MLAVAHAGFVRARVLDWVSARISQDFGILVQADALRYNLLTTSVELRRPRLSVRGDRPFLQADAIRVALDHRVLFGVFELQRLEFDQPRVTILRHPDGATNLPTSRSDPTSSPAPIHLGRVGLTALIVEVEDESAGHRVAAGPISLRLDTRAGAVTPGTFGPSPVGVRIGSTDAQRPVRSLSGTLNGGLEFDGSRLTIHDLRLEAPEGRLSLAGWLDVISESTGVEMRGRLETDLARAGPLILPPGDPLTGSATTEVVVRGAMANPTVRLEVTGRNLRFRSTPEISLAASGTYAAGRADIDRLAVTSDVGDIEATATLYVTTGDGKPGESRLAGRITRLDLDRALSAAGLSLPVAIGSTAGGNINLSLDAGTPANLDSWRYLRGDGSIELTPVGSGLSLSGRVDLAARDRRWTVAHALRAEAGRTTLEGTIAADLPDSNLSGRLSGKTQLQIQEIRTLLPVLRRAGVTLSAPFDQIDGTLDVQIVPRGALDAPTLNATLNGRRIRLPDVTDEGELSSTVMIDRRGLTAKSLDARLGDLRVAGSGAYTWQGRIETEFKAVAGDLSAIAAAFDLADASLEGSTELEGVVRGSIQSPQGRAQLTANGLSAYGVQVGAVAAQLQLGSERLDIDATAPALEMHLTGTLGTRSPFRFQAEADLDRSPVSAFLSAPQTKHLSGEGTIAATVRANGTVQQIAETAGEIELRALDVKVSGVPMSLDSRASWLSARPLFRQLHSACGSGVKPKYGWKERSPRTSRATASTCTCRARLPTCSMPLRPRSQISWSRPGIRALSWIFMSAAR